MWRHKSHRRKVEEGVRGLCSCEKVNLVCGEFEWGENVQGMMKVVESLVSSGDLEAT